MIKSCATLFIVPYYIGNFDMEASTYVPILNTLISSGVSLLVAFGTWHISMKKDRKEQTDEVKTLLNQHREEYLSGIRSVQDDITQINATVQNQISIIDVKLDTLSERVERHNQVIDRTYALERDSALHEEQITNMGRRISNLEDR